MYLNREAVEDTLRKIGSCASGSVVAFDYFTTEVLPSQALYWRFARISTRVASEPLKFGVEGSASEKGRLPILPSSLAGSHWLSNTFLGKRRERSAHGEASLLPS